MNDPIAPPEDEPDSQPEAAAESDPQSQVGIEVVPLRPWQRAVVRGFSWILPPLLAGVAVAVHFELNVPDHIEHNPRDQGERKAGKAGKARAGREKFQARDQVRLDREWRKWKDQKFDGEPVRGPWARKFQTVISKAVVVARRDAFAKAPEEPRVIVTGTECRTVRCRFILRSPFEHELTVLDATLARLVDHNGTIWRTYESQAIQPPSDAPEGHHHREVIVSFASDEVDSRGFVVGAPPEGGAPGAGTSPAPGPAVDEPDDEAPDDALGQPDEPEEERGGGADEED